VYLIIGIILLKKNFEKPKTVDEIEIKKLIRSKNYYIIRNFALYPIIFIIFFLFPSINRVLNVVDNERSFFWLSILTSASLTFRGTINFIIFFISQNVFEVYKKTFFTQNAIQVIDNDEISIVDDNNPETNNTNFDYDDAYGNVILFNYIIGC
jgi:hypothetical protein